MQCHKKTQKYLIKTLPISLRDIYAVIKPFVTWREFLVETAHACTQPYHISYVLFIARLRAFWRSDMDPLYTWRAADALIKLFGRQALAHATMRADELLTQGDRAGYIEWKLITRTITDMQQLRCGGRSPKEQRYFQ